ncbi:hypothetical protein M404DRAFT_11309 [Pisolithus tinctorius Marx 270]|uniref:Uncharacterized protein n=1 Tax=Pisolithus tinctorius Marx 270 TaxID=870435 RepID=A0A0C3NFN5_PISTI|nr:hypothetical protein M404DRAFT_11309 [Pisolithus tinctorius Marx 270]
MRTWDEDERRKGGRRACIPDLSGQGKADLAEVKVVSIVLPICGFGLSGLSEEDWLVLTVTEGDADGSVLGEETGDLPGRRGIANPAGPLVCKEVVNLRDVTQGEVDAAMAIAISMSKKRRRKEEMDVTNPEASEEISEEHGDHEGMIWKKGGEGEGDHRDPELFVEAIADVEETACMIEREGHVPTFWPEFVWKGEIEGDAPIVICREVCDGDVQATASAEEKGEVEIVTVDEGADVGMVDVDEEVIVDDQPGPMAEDADGGVVMAMFIESDMDVALVMSVVIEELVWDVCDVEGCDGEQVVREEDGVVEIDGNEIAEKDERGGKGERRRMGKRRTYGS